MRLRCHLSLLSMRVCALLVCLASTTPAQCDLQWSPGDGFPGTDGAVAALVTWDPDGAGPATALVVVGGDFDRVATLTTSNVATWDPQTGAWGTLGTGMLGSVAALAVLPNGDLIAGGYWITPTGVEIDDVARWDGSAWVPFGFGTSGTVSCLRVLANGDLLVGGQFASAGGVAASGLARWDGTSWSAVGPAPGLTAASGAAWVRAITETSNGDVVVAGSFTAAGGVPANSIARWDGTTWQPLGGGVPPFLFDNVRAVHVRPNGDLVLGGLFSQVGGVPASCIARWDGVTWHALGEGVFFQGPGWQAMGALSFLELANGDLVVGGVFNRAGGLKANGIATWNGSTWTPLGTGGATTALLPLPNGDFLAGGGHTGHGEGVSRWDGAAWHALATGFSDLIYSLAELSDGSIAAGGLFTSAGATAARRLAVRGAGGWSELGGVSIAIGTPEVRLLATRPGHDLFVKGNFTHIGGVAAGGLARFDGANWWPLTASGSPSVNGMMVRSDGDLVIVGNFSTVSGVSAARIARWDGTTWQAFGSGLGSQARAVVELPNGDLVVAGDFTTAGGVPANRVARWDGSSWSAMGAGLSGSTSTLVVMPDGSVVASGTFGPVRRWDGTTWSPLASLAREPVALLALPNGDLLAAGSSLLTTTGPETLVRLSGGTWSTVPGMPNGTVLSAVQCADGRVVLGGTFTEAGGQPSVSFAELVPSCPALAQDIAPGCAGAGGANTLTAVTLPWVDATFRARGTGLSVPAVVLAVTSVTPVAPALALDSVFAEALPGCTLHVAPDILQTLLSTDGTAESSLYLPSTPPLVGVTFRHQMVPFAVDAFGAFVEITSTNALQLTVGSF